MNTSAPRTERTMCLINCHRTLCGMLATVEDKRLVAVRFDESPDLFPERFVLRAVSKIQRLGREQHREYPAPVHIRLCPAVNLALRQCLRISTRILI